MAPFLEKFSRKYSLPETSCERLLGRMERLAFRKGECVVREGERNYNLYVVSRGIWQALSGADLEDLLAGGESPQEKARQIVWAAGRKPGDDKENGSAVILRAEEAEDAAD